MSKRKSPLTEAPCDGSASAQARLIPAQAGYGAELSHPKAKPPAESSIPSEALTAATPELPAAHDEDDSQQLLINGSELRQLRLPGTKRAAPRCRASHRRGLTWRTHGAGDGGASAAELVQAVEKAGYGAEAIEDDLGNAANASRKPPRDDETFSLRAIVALLVGVPPVMVWGMIGDNMMVSDDNRSLWLVIGLVTPPSSWSSPAATSPQRGKARKRHRHHGYAGGALGTGVASLYSMSAQPVAAVVPDGSPHLYYEASAMIIGLINLGHMLEA